MMEFGDFCGETPEDFWVRILSPYRKDEDDPDKDINDMSVVLNATVSEYRFLYPGDSSATIWCERIKPYMLKKEEFKDWKEEWTFSMEEGGQQGEIVIWSKDDAKLAAWLSAFEDEGTTSVIVAMGASQ